MSVCIGIPWGDENRPIWEKFSQKKDERLESRTEETILSNSEMYRNTIMTKEHWQKNYVVPFNKNSVEKLLIQ